MTVIWGEPSQLEYQTCRHGGHGNWALEREGIYAGMWVDADPLCRRPSLASLKRIENER